MADNETTQLLTDADHVKNMTDSQGWGVVKAKLDQRILDLQNINNLDLVKIETLPQQLAARKMAVDEIWAWLKQDVYGFVQQQESNNQDLSDKQEEFIGRE